MDRDTVAAMVAAGIAQADIARCRAISEPTLRKHYKEEIRTGTKWWQQARMGWTEGIVVNDRKPANTPLRVIVEFVGEPAPRVEQSASRSGPRLSENLRGTVQLVG